MELNKYLDFMETDFELCKPIMKGQQIELLPFYAIHMANVVDHNKGPKIILDLEQIQVLDYTQLPNITEEQKHYIGQKLSTSPFAPEDLAFLALKSLFSFSWDKLENQSDAILALKVEAALNYLIKETSMTIAGDLIYQDSLLPYWVRLSFLRVMSKIPPEIIESSNLSSVACFPNKKKTFNAFSTILTKSSVIGFNYALEPILKILNRFFIHFFSTQHLAGPSRIERAWGEILPVVRYFSGKSTAAELMSGCLVMSFEDGKLIQCKGSEQIDFIMMHELGHIFYNHPKILHELKGASDEVEIRHDFEIKADEFAHKIYFSWFHESIEMKEELDKKVGEYASFLESIELLFIYMDFINKAKTIISEILGSEYIHQPIDTHPSSDKRLIALRNASGLELNSEMVKFAEEFFASILEYIANLDKERILSGLEPVNMKEA